MISKFRRELDFLQDIDDAIERILHYTDGLTWGKYLRDPKTQDAVVRNLEVIGEATKNLSPELRSRFPDIPWRDMAETRDGGFEGRPFYLRPAAAMHAWARGNRWEQVVDAAKMEEGDLAILILRTADNLRHVAGLAEILPEAAGAAARAAEMMLREPVVE